MGEFFYIVRVKPSYQFLSHYAFGRRKALAIALVLGVASNALDQLAPFGLKLVIDRLEVGQSATGLWPWMLALGGATLLSALFLFWQRFIIITRSRDVEMEIRNDLFRQLQCQPKAFFDHNPVGDLMSRVANDVDRIRDMLGPGMLHLARMGFGFIYASVALFWISPRLAAVGLATSLLLPLASLHFRKTLHAAFRRSSEKLSSMSVLVQETLGGIHVVKGLGREEYFNQRFEKASLDFQTESAAVALHTSRVWPSINLISGLSLCLAIYYGAVLVAKDELSVGSLATAVIFLVRVQFPLVGLGWVATMIQRGQASLERLLDLRDRMRPCAPEEHAGVRDSFARIELRDLHFSYHEDGAQVLQGIHLDLLAGKSLGIVGETGCGKSTLLHVLAGIESPPPGTCFVDGTDVASLPPGEYASLFALAPQDGFLFSESIAENIRLGENARSRYTVEEVAQAACLESDLRGFPDGIETLLGEKGINLSGGQKQRVGLARALLAQAPVLLLDDTLSAVDSATERTIVGHLRSSLAGQTVVIVSHRYSAVAHCDEIVVLDQGRIVERGTHAELLRKEGLYASTWEKQQHHE